MHCCWDAHVPLDHVSLYSLTPRRRTDRQTHTQTGRQTDRQTDTHTTHKHTHTLTHSLLTNINTQDSDGKVTQHGQILIQGPGHQDDLCFRKPKAPHRLPYLHGAAVSIPPVLAFNANIPDTSVPCPCVAMTNAACDPDVRDYDQMPPPSVSPWPPPLSSSQLPQCIHLHQRACGNSSSLSLASY